MSSNNGTVTTPVNTPPTTPPILNSEPVLETEKLITFIDEQIPSGESFFNNLETFTNTSGTDIAIASTYRHGPSGYNFEDKVQIQVISASGSIAQINLPQLSVYRWGWKAVNSVSPNVCFLSNSRDNGKDKLYYLVYCNGPIGFRSYILSLNTTAKILSVALDTTEFIYDIKINHQDELVYLTHSYDASTTLFTYTLKKYPAAQVIDSVVSNQLNGFSLSNVNIIQNPNGDYLINLVKSVSDTYSFALYSFASNSMQTLNLTRNATQFLQDKDTKKVFYYNSGSSQLASGLFSINLSNSNDTKQSEDVNYIYKYQSLGEGLFTKYGMPYGTSKGLAWFSYDEGKSFKEILNTPAQTNQIVRTINKEMYLVGVNQYSNNRVVATLYKLKEH